MYLGKVIERRQGKSDRVDHVIFNDTLRDPDGDVSDSLGRGSHRPYSALVDEKKDEETHKPGQGRYSCAASIGGLSVMQLSKPLASLGASLSRLSSITSHQRHVLGLSVGSALEEPSLVVDEDLKTESIALSRCSLELVAPIPGEIKVTDRGLKTANTAPCMSWCGTEENELAHWMISTEEDKTRQELDDDGARGLTHRAAVCGREELSRLLAAAENEIDDLKYVYEQDVRSLQEELGTLRDVAMKLRHTELARHQESASAAVQLALCEEEISGLRKLLAVSMEKKFLPPKREKAVEDGRLSEIKSLEDALAIAARMNTVLLEKAEKRDAAYCSALREIDSLRMELATVKDETRRQEETYEERIKLMKEEISALNGTKDSVGVVENEMLQFTKQHNMVMEYREEVKRLRSALSEANRLVLALKSGVTPSPSLRWAGKAGHDVFTQSDTIVRSDASVNTSADWNPTGNASKIAELMDEIERLTREREEWQEELEALKQAHSIETEFLTENLLRTESQLREFQLRANASQVSI